MTNLNRNRAAVFWNKTGDNQVPPSEAETEFQFIAAIEGPVVTDTLALNWIWNRFYPDAAIQSGDVVVYDGNAYFVKGFGDYELIAEGWNKMRARNYNTLRAEELAGMLRVKRNAKLCSRIDGWLMESASEAEKRLRNGEIVESKFGQVLCFNFMQKYVRALSHSINKPKRDTFKTDEAFFQAMDAYNGEFSQNASIDENGHVLREGVIYSADTLRAFCKTAMPFCAEAK